MRVVEIPSTSNNDVLRCAYCDYSFNEELPHFSCRKAHEKNSTFVICQICFFSWIHGEIRSDNIGYQNRICNCYEKITHADVKSVLTPEQFDEYDSAMTRHTLSKDKNVLYCPGVDCGTPYFKPKTNKRSKRSCRKATCDNCDTEFCCKCGELYTTDHKRMKCGPYKKWKRANDEETITMTNWRDSHITDIKTCPGCKNAVERTSGCNEMRCTVCDMKFCWRCGKKRIAGICGC